MLFDSVRVYNYGIACLHSMMSVVHCRPWALVAHSTIRQ